MNSSASLSHELPYWEFLDQPFSHLILWDGSLSTGVEILPLDIECFDEGRINQLVLGLRSFVNSLPEGITGQFYVKVETDFEEIISSHEKLAQSNVIFLNDLDKSRIGDLRALVAEGSVFRPKLYFSLKTEAAEKPKTFALSAAKKFSTEFGKFYEDRIQTLSQSIEGVRSQLSNLGFYSEQLTRDQMISLIYKHLNPTRSTELSAPNVSRSCAIDGSSPREQLVFGDLILDQEDFELDRVRTRVLTLKTLPEMTFAGMMNGFLNLPFKYELFFSFHIQEQGK